MRPSAIRPDIMGPFISTMRVSFMHSVSRGRQARAMRNQHRRYAPFVRVVSLALALTLVGCTSEMKLIPTPVVYQDADRDHFALTSSADRGTSVSIFYATDRNPVETDDPEERYGNQRGMVLRLGTATAASRSAPTAPLKAPSTGWPAEL